MDYLDITKLESCPACETSWIISYIPQDLIDKGYHSSDSKFYSRVLGVEYLGTDRISGYQCPGCSQFWNREGQPTEVKQNN